MRGAASSTTTSEPNRENAWASSSPIAPPPMTTSDAGAAVAWSASRFVQNGVSARPSIGGTAAVVPVLSTTPREATMSSTPPSDVSTSTVRWPANRPWPRTSRAPAAARRSAAAVSSQSAVATSRMRRATGAKSGVTSA